MKEKVKKFYNDYREDVILGAAAGGVLLLVAGYGFTQGRKGMIRKAIAQVHVDAAYDRGWRDGAHSVLTHDHDIREIN